MDEPQVILPESTNTSPIFGKIFKILCCQKEGYIYYQEMKSSYCPKSDLYFVSDTENFDMLPCLHLPSYHTLEGYPVGAGEKMSLSIRTFIPEHI